MANIQKTHLPDNEDLEAESIRRFELYQAIKTEHERRKGDLKQTLEREKTRVQKETRDAKHLLEERLGTHVKEHNAAVNDENRQYRADLTDLRRQSSRETRPGHSPSTEEMEAEEIRLFEAFQRARTEHGRRMNRLNQDVESRKEYIRGKMQERDERLPHRLAEASNTTPKRRNFLIVQQRTPPRQQQRKALRQRGHSRTESRALGNRANFLSHKRLYVEPNVQGRRSEICLFVVVVLPLNNNNLPLLLRRHRQTSSLRLLRTDLHSLTKLTQIIKDDGTKLGQPSSRRKGRRELRSNFQRDSEAQARSGTSKHTRRRRSEGPSPDPDTPVAKKQKTRRTILFDEVNAETKDWRFEEISIIVEYPPKSNIWYILRCQQCGPVFFTVQGAGQHLSGRTHGSSRRWGEAVKQLGVHVVDCDAKKARRNNDAFEIACLQGHNPKRRLDRAPWRFHGSCRDKTTASRQEDEIEDLTDSELNLVDDEYVPSDEEIDDFIPEKESQKQPFLGVAEPVAGELYQAYWGADDTWYLVTVLPLGGFQEIGIAGHLQDLDLRFNIPSCYEVERDSFHIIGWKDGFIDGGSCVTERKFPCLFFSEDFKIPLTGELGLPGGRLYAWLSAQDLRQIDYRQPGAHNAKSSGCIAAENFRKRVAAMRDPRPAAQPEADMVGQNPGSRSEEQQHGHNAPHDDSNAKTIIGVRQELQGGSSSLRSLKSDQQGQMPASNHLRQGPTALRMPRWDSKQEKKVYCEVWVRILAWGSVSRAGGGESKDLDDTGGVHHEISSLSSGQAPKDGLPVALWITVDSMDIFMSLISLGCLW
ncbi:hypothetical protein VM1G_02017 [Cytospora mali]|uniref:C2H2-type domain-containing protein n=1 Tax=Cytospora mali TaxID=578113 RepID=A0A194VQ73_CYTMA|nr:hypothetical protein VM1G_02017 [Valsa mali]